MSADLEEKEKKKEKEEGAEEEERGEGGDWPVDPCARRIRVSQKMSVFTNAMEKFKNDYPDFAAKGWGPSAKARRSSPLLRWPLSSLFSFLFPSLSVYENHSRITNATTAAFFPFQTTRTRTNNADYVLVDVSCAAPTPVGGGGRRSAGTVATPCSAGSSSSARATRRRTA